VDKLRALWVMFFQVPDDFQGQPYEGALNQLGHATFGAISCGLICGVWYFLFDTMPYRWGVFFGAVLVYLVLVEIKAQGWQRSDTLADTYFFSLGSAAALAPFKEQTSGLLSFSPNALFVPVGLLFFSLMFYAWRRL